MSVSLKLPTLRAETTYAHTQLSSETHDAVEAYSPSFGCLATRKSALKASSQLW